MPPNQPYRRGLTQMWKPRAEHQAKGTLVERILAARGLTDPEEVRLFLKPSLLHLHDPSLMTDLDKGAARMLEAARSGQPIVIYGDYDVDGVTATAILFHMLRAVAPQADVRTYVPHRLEEGYGLNAAAIDQLAAVGAKVIVSVDCGVTAVEPALAARRAGVDLIITDHHNPPEGDEALPAAYAVIHPRRPGSTYPFGELSGAGVAYKLAWRIASMHCGAARVSESLRALLLELLSFASLGAIADIVDLRGENRVLAAFGLGRIKNSSNPGLRALVEASGLAGDDIDTEHVGFALGPRLNACGRMGHAREAVELFTTAEGERATEIAQSLTQHNNERRTTERRIAEQAMRLAEEAGMTLSDRRAIVLAHEDWHPGVVGIVCSRLVDKFCRPTILMQRKDGVCAGSGRSIEGFSLHSALQRCAEHLTTFGGHDMAAGLKLDADRLDAFAAAFIEAANAEIRPEHLTPSLWVDCDALLSEVTPEAVRELDRLAPFGPGNARPRVRITDAIISSQPEPFGGRGDHLTVMVRSRTSSRIIRLVGWKWAEWRDQLAAGMSIEAVVHPRLNVWNGTTRVEPELADLRVCEPA